MVVFSEFPLCVMHLVLPEPNLRVKFISTKYRCLYKNNTATDDLVGRGIPEKRGSHFLRFSQGRPAHPFSRVFLLQFYTVELINCVELKYTFTLKKTLPPKSQGITVTGPLIEEGWTLTKRLRSKGSSCPRNFRFSRMKDE